MGFTWVRVSNDYVMNQGDIVFRLQHNVKDLGWTDFSMDKVTEKSFSLQVRKEKSVKFVNLGYVFKIGSPEYEDSDSVDRHLWNNMQHIVNRSNEILDCLFALTGTTLMDSPWGEVEDMDIYLTGHIFDVHTPSHGGLMISKEYAKLFLSPAARRFGSTFENYLCYEEDCEWFIPAYELRTFWPLMIKKTDKDIKRNPEAYILQQIEASFPDYLAALSMKKA
ncbi:DUF7007 domain-containing protein [Paenibacillus sp. D51F]